jgi:diaminopimelate epimerase
LIYPVGLWVEARGDRLTIAWNGVGHSVWMTGPAVTMFEGEMHLPERA